MDDGQTNNPTAEPSAEPEGLVESAPEATEESAAEDTPVESEGVEESEDGHSDEEPEATLVDVKYDGQEYSVPPELEKALMRQSDYTKKMQDISDEKRKLEANTETLQQQTELQIQHLDHATTIKALDQQLAGYDQVDWDKAYNDDPVEAMKLDRQKRDLQENRQQAVAGLQQAQYALESQRATEHAKIIEQGQAVLVKEIPGWNDDMAKKTREYGKSIGISDADLSRVSNPVHVRLIHDSMVLTEMLAKQTAKAKPVTQEPVAKVKGRRQSGKRDPEKMSTDEWMRHRNSQLAKAATQ